MEKQHYQQARFEDGFLNPADSYFEMPFRTTVKYHISIRDDEHPGEVFLLNGDADTIRQKSIHGPTWELDLPADKYFIIDLASQQKLKLDVRPTASTDTVDLTF